MRTQDEIRRTIGYYTKAEPSRVGLRVATLLEEWSGLHHFEDSLLKKVDWSNPLYIEMKLSSQTSTGQLSTFDFNSLTALVFLAHDHCIRVALKPCNGTHFKLIFHPRNSRDGDVSTRHPTIERAVERWRQGHSAVDLSEFIATAEPAEAK